MTPEQEALHNAVPANESEEEFFRRWDLPDVTQISNSEREKALQLRQQQDDLLQESEPEEPPESYTMTAEALEEIRQAAYEEGFEQGQQEGYQKGHPEGLAAGHQEGLDKGLEEGRQQGLAQGQAEIAEQCARLDALMRGLHEPQQQLDQQVEYQLVELTGQLAKAVIQHELATNSQVILNTLREAVRLLPFHQQQARVQLNPSDLELIQQNYSDEQIKQRGWQLEAEPSLPIGDLRLLTESSDVTVDMEERTQRVMQQFLAQLQRFQQPHEPEVANQSAAEATPPSNPEASDEPTAE